MDPAIQGAEQNQGKPEPKPRASRVVSQLSDEKLARKRAADRESQRGLRQRTRVNIERLEKRVEELSNADTELTAAKKRTAELEEELEKLKATLVDLNNGTFITESEGSQYQSSIESISPASSSKEDSPLIISSNRIQPSKDLVSISSILSKNALPYRINENKSLETKTQSPKSSRNLSNIIKHRKRSKNPSQVSQIYGFLGPDGLPSFSSSSFLKQPTVHAWELPLYTKDPDGPIDQILFGMIQQQKALTHGGGSQMVAIGPRYPNLNVLVVPELSHLAHPVSRVICDLLKRITYRSFIDKLAALLVMYPLYQWQIARTYENFAAIPAYSKPLLSQRTIPHPVWMCALGWPKLRDFIIANQETYCTEEFLYLFTMSINVNWKKGIRDAICWGKDGVTVTREFWEHSRVMDNYSMDRPFAARFPELEAFCKFTEYPTEDV